MKIFRKAVILLVLAVSYLMLEREQPAYAQTSCPARDACLDTAYNNYVNGIALANQYYISCETTASTSRNQCLDSAEAAKFSCEREADMAYETYLSRCQLIPDPHEAEHCMQEIELMRQQAYSMCSSTYDNSVQLCWWTYSSDVAGCETVFYAFANAAQSIWDTERLACDQLC